MRPKHPISSKLAADLIYFSCLSVPRLKIVFMYKNRCTPFLTESPASKVTYPLDARLKVLGSSRYFSRVNPNFYLFTKRSSADLSLIYALLDYNKWLCLYKSGLFLTISSAFYLHVQFGPYITSLNYCLLIVEDLTKWSKLSGYFWLTRFFSIDPSLFILSFCWIKLWYHALRQS